jgi:hypothetical protein
MIITGALPVPLDRVSGPRQNFSDCGDLFRHDNTTPSLALVPSPVARRPSPVTVGDRLGTGTTSTLPSGNSCPVMVRISQIQKFPRKEREDVIHVDG